MLLTQQQLRRFSAPNFLLPPVSPFPFSHSLNLPFRPTKQWTHCSAHKLWTVQLSEEPTTATAPPPAEGPVELPPSTSSIFATDDEPTPLQTATSVLLTGAITVFLFRSLRRRAKRAKETVMLLPSPLPFSLFPPLPPSLALFFFDKSLSRVVT